MPQPRNHTFVCSICEKSKPSREGRSAELVHGPIGKLINAAHPDWDSSHIICLSCLNRFRTDYVEHQLTEQRGEMTALESEVVNSLREEELLSQNVSAAFERELSFGERIADKVATFGGSWRFIIIFGSLLVVWIAINSIALLTRPFDPFPYILLNLILSCLAAVQAPVIMMSQNRQEAKDRARAEHEYQINLKAEIEVRQLHTKIDHLVNHSWQRLLDIQQIQLEIMQEMAERSRPDGGKGDKS